MNLSDLTARSRRLDVLARGLAKEVALWKEVSGSPLLYVERRTYLKGIQDALAGIETARVILARARERMKGAP